MSLLLDMVEESSLDEAVDGSTYVRSGIAYDLEGAALPSDPGMLFRALVQAGMPRIYDVHPSNSNFKCNRRQVRPLSDDMCKVLAYYVAGPQQPPGSTWLIQESTSLVQDTTEIHPGTGEPLKVVYKPAPPAGGKPESETGHLSYPRPMRRLTFSGFIDRNMVPGITPTGPPNTDLFSQVVGTVNADPWQGKPPGFWLCAGFDDETRDRGVSYIIKLEFLTKIREDWSSFLIGRRRDGTAVPVLKEDVQRLLKLPYIFDIRRQNGCIKTGLYPPVNFGQLFGS